MTRDTLSTIQADFMRAIDRLVDGEPLNPKLIQRKRDGSLVLNFSTVALEAGRSRTLIAVDPARLPDVRKRIIELTNKSTKEESDGDAISLLKSELEETRRALGRSLQAQAEYCLARDRAQRSSKRWRDALRRKTESQRQTSNVVEFPRR